MTPRAIFRKIGRLALSSGNLKERSRGERQRGSGTAAQEPITFDNLPVELVREILDYLLPSSALPFALTCRRFHSLAIPVLYRRIHITDHDFKRFVNEKVSVRDPRLVNVRDVRISGDFNRTLRLSWGGHDFQKLFQAFPNLQTLDTTRANPCMGNWEQFLDILSILPPTAQELRVKLWRFDGSLQSWRSAPTFPSIRRLALEFDEGHSIRSVYDTDSRFLPPTPSMNFPALHTLAIRFSNVHAEPAWFFRDVHFPALRDFAFGDAFVLNGDDGAVGAFARFLARHSGTLRALDVRLFNATPAAGEPKRVEDMRAALRGIPLRFERLCMDPPAVAAFAGVALEGLEQLDVAHCLHKRGSRACIADLSGVVCPAVRRLTMRPCVLEKQAQFPWMVSFPVKLYDLHRVFPELETLELCMHADINIARTVEVLNSFEYSLLQCRGLETVAVSGDGEHVERFTLSASPGRPGKRKLRKVVEARTSGLMRRLSGL
ncbi:uncharacterized protein BXZ73DRAFT_99265 [Epithele typhae]|uniref:uncharacterized protein n=1 Tax=Epithele typhae TaxID=378194 RepID=UPI00200802C5|nr:uncharacterized protein BXZ73DRAFT_99265 [Epithele typhae]KAH9939651.1 hypothetical protein BXZ73DRAFT_99265 [Epithele typhae]